MVLWYYSNVVGSTLRGYLMPINQVIINNSIKYYVVDSKMEKLIAWLDNHAIKKDDSESVIEDEKIS